MPRACAALATSALLVAALALALPSTAAAPLEADVVYAESNRGLMPERFQAYGIMHYAQMVQPAEAAKGTIVSGGGAARGSCNGAACLLVAAAACARARPLP